MKKLLAIALALVLTLTLVACGGGKAPTEPATESAPAATPTPKPEPASGNGKAYEFLKKYFTGDKMTMTFSTDGVDDKATFGMDGERCYVEAAAEGYNMRIIIDGSNSCIIIDEMEMYMTMNVDDAEDMNPVESFVEEDIPTKPIATGTMEFEGKSYDYEAYQDGDTEMRYLFSGNDIVYMLTMNGEEVESWVKLESISADVDVSKFEIPAGYTEMDLGDFAA